MSEARTMVNIDAEDIKTPIPDIMAEDGFLKSYEARLNATCVPSVNKEQFPKELFDNVTEMSESCQVLMHDMAV
jgi:hypothetical protein